MVHRHIDETSPTPSSAAIDDIIERGSMDDWIDLREKAKASGTVVARILRVCDARCVDPYAQRHHFWRLYAKQLVAEREPPRRNPQSEDTCQTFAVNIELTTKDRVFVRANSLSAAMAAVQSDFDNGGRVMVEDILRIENEVPYDTARAVSGEEETECFADYVVDESGSLERTCDHDTRMGTLR